MPKLVVLAVFDSKVNSFAQPFFMRTRGEALRGWADVANDPQSNVCKYPLDYSLMELGTYEDSSGRFENYTAPISLGTAAEFKSQPQSEVPLIDHIQSLKTSVSSPSLAKAVQ